MVPIIPIYEGVGHNAARVGHVSEIVGFGWCARQFGSVWDLRGVVLAAGFGLSAVKGMFRRILGIDGLCI
jgi:hypothetical protein